WACERTTASMEEAANGRLRFLRSASLRRPWLSPQSRRKRRPPDSTRCMEPVTPPAAPQNVSFIKGHGSASAKQQGEVLFFVGQDGSLRPSGTRPACLCGFGGACFCLPV